MPDIEPTPDRSPTEITIRCREHGPLVVELPAGIGLRVIDHLGRSFPLPTLKKAVALCRCGQSGNRPFCDGSHRACGFQAPETGCLLPDVADGTQT
jgi:CDGSH-type Zn-finger protein